MAAPWRRTLAVLSITAGITATLAPVLLGLIYTYKSIKEGAPPAKLVPRPAVWFPGEDVSGNHHGHRHYSRISEVLKMSGFYFGDESTNWILLHGMTNHMIKQFKKVPVPTEMQKVNFVPGLQAVTKKHNFLPANITGTLPGFNLPNDRDTFMKYVKEHPDKMWIRKTQSDRGLGTLLVRNIGKVFLSHNFQSFQEYVKDPFLIHGRKVVAAVFVIITSVNPLRVYVDNTDWVVRVSGDNYYPFRPDKAEANIGWSDFISTMPVFDDTYDTFNMTNKELLLHYIKDKGFDAAKVETRVIQNIYNVLSEREAAFIDNASQMMVNRISENSKRNYYETVRFDFVFDKNLNAFICEVQGPPGMRAEGLPKYYQKYHRIFYNIMQLNGVGIFHDPLTLLRESSNDPHLHVASDINHFLSNNCSCPGCDLRLSCLSEDELIVLRQTYTEHIHRSDFQRVIPKPFQDESEASVFLKQDYTHDRRSLEYRNDWLRRWFALKCIESDDWCS